MMRHAAFPYAPSVVRGGTILLLGTLCLPIGRDAIAQPTDPLPTPSEAGVSPPSASPSMGTSNPALGIPPAGATFTPDTRSDPGFADRPNETVVDQTYGSTARTVGPNGEVLEGLHLQDYDGLLPGDAGYVDEVPSEHVVQTGDTLWDISGNYFGDAYLWPKVWSWNEQVTNAHWIFPGDRIRLRDTSAEANVAVSGNTFDFNRRQPPRAEPKTFVLSQIAFISSDDFDTALKVIGGGDANVMMSTLDTVYMSYDHGNPPVPGERLVVYAPTEKVRELKGRGVAGHVVQIMGEVEVRSVSREAAEGVIVNALNPIERGFRVGPLRRIFQRIETIPAEQSVTGYVIATLTTTGPIAIKSRQSKRDEQKYMLAADQQYVIVDLGEADGVKVGNVLEVIQKGDGFTKKRVFAIPYEDGWPRRLLGKLVVVDVQEKTALAAVTYARQEFERGDHVELRGPGLHSTPDAAVATEQTQARPAYRLGGSAASD